MRPPVSSFFQRSLASSPGRSSGHVLSQCHCTHERPPALARSRAQPLSGREKTRAKWPRAQGPDRTLRESEYTQTRPVYTSNESRVDTGARKRRTFHELVLVVDSKRGRHFAAAATTWSVTELCCGWGALDGLWSTLFPLGCFGGTCCGVQLSEQSMSDVACGAEAVDSPREEKEPEVTGQVPEQASSLSSRRSVRACHLSVETISSSLLGCRNLFSSFAVNSRSTAAAARVAPCLTASCGGNGFARRRVIGALRCTSSSSAFLELLPESAS